MSISPHDPVAPESADRAPKGRFALGNKGGPGNPFARQVAEIRKLLLNTVPGERLAKIVLALVEKAEAGDVAAAKLVLQYTVGKPAEAVEPDRVEIEEHRLRRESTISFEEWSPKVGDLSAATVNSFAPTLGPDNEENTLMPFLLGALEAEAAPPEKRGRVERRRNPASDPDAAGGDRAVTKTALSGPKDRKCFAGSSASATRNETTRRSRPESAEIIDRTNGNADETGSSESAGVRGALRRGAATGQETVSPAPPDRL